MRSIKTKLFSLAMAVSMVLALAGCAMSTPSTVGSIGGVEIPAGIYLLAQYNSYNTASGLAKLATGETASDVKAVLKAPAPVPSTARRSPPRAASMWPS